METFGRQVSRRFTEQSNAGALQLRPKKPQLAEIQEEVKQAKTSMKVDNEMKRPLLLDVEFADEETEEEERKNKVMQMMISPRINTRAMTMAFGGGQ